MKIVRKLILLLQRGLSERRIAHELRISRPSVSRFRERLVDSGKNLEELLDLEDPILSTIVQPKTEKNIVEDERTDFIALRKDYYVAELRRTGVTRMLLWQEYLKDNPSGYAYSKFCELLAELALPGQASYHMPPYEPAAMMMVDFAGDKISYINRFTGELVACSVFVSVLPYSGYSYAIALANERTPCVIKALNASLSYFGGAPRSLKCDNMRTAVIKGSNYEPVFTEVFEQWALHNSIALFAARPRKPKDKAPVEKEVLLTYQRLYAPIRDREFFSLEEINGAFEEQLKIHHQMYFQKKTISRLEQFLELEKEYLQPLPKTPFVICHKDECKLKMNYHILLKEDNHQYSVPYKYIGKMIVVNYDIDQVEVFYNMQRIAIHKRSYKKDGYTTMVEHMPPDHQSFTEQFGWDADYFRREALKIGINTQQFIEKVLQGRLVIQQAFEGCKGILRLANRYTPERLEAACKRALPGSRYGYNTIDNTLKNNLDKLNIDEPDLFHIPTHDNNRKPDEFL